MPVKGHTIAICPLTATELSGKELAVVARRAGYDVMGLRFWKADHYGTVLANDPKELKETIAVIRDNGMTVYDLTVAGLDGKTTAADYAPTLEAAASTGARHLVVVGRDPERSRFEDEFAKLCRHAAPYGLQLHIEFMGTSGVRTLAETFRAVSQVSEGNGRILLDTLHVMRNGDGPDEIAKYDPRYFTYAQICDAPATTADPDFELRNERLFPGEGALPLRQILDALPPGIPLSVEVPQESRRLAGVSALQRATEAYAATRRFLEG